MDLLAHIRIFMDIADRGSLAAVARERNLAPSAITASLSRLERHVGAKLFLRSTRSLALTSEGQQFLESSRKVFNDLDAAIEQVANEGPLRGTIRLTSINDFGRARLSTLIDSFIARHPEVRVELTLGDEVFELVDGGYDLGIRTGPLSDSRLRARLLLRCGRSVCAAPSYWRKHGKPLRPEELANHNCLVLSRTGAPQSVWRFNDGTTPSSVSVTGDRTANDGGLLRQWAIEGAGVVLKSDYDISADIQDRRLETALDEFKESEMNLYAVHAAGTQPSRRLHAFIEHLVESLLER
jgi:DNA-binding transcriptional LysR family regulator